jgi:hypothetical protein
MRPSQLCSDPHRPDAHLAAEEGEAERQEAASQPIRFWATKFDDDATAANDCAIMERDMDSMSFPADIFGG